MSDYQSDKNRIYTEKIRSALVELPPFCREFFRGIENSCSILTRFAYTTDLKLFFDFLTGLDEFNEKIIDMNYATLEKIRPVHIEMFLEHLNYYSRDSINRENHERAKARKLSAIRSLLKYFFKKEILQSNVASLVDIPKIHDKPIIRLDVNEVANLLDNINSGEKLTKRQILYHEYTKLRDNAIITLLLGTGIRVSELVGLNVKDFDFVENAFTVTRKGGNRVVLYFNDEVKRALCEYFDDRVKAFDNDCDEDAFFLSMQKKRINQRTVQNLVKKYSRISAPLKKISPHKLRSTFGTMLYQETGDIYLVADVLGHKDVNTTKKHYAAIEDERRRIAANAIKLRDD